MNDLPLVLIGTSVRAAAQSAAAAGYDVYTADLFADRDLPESTAACRVVDYPGGLIAALDGLPPGPWLYTGGLEDFPDLVDAAATRRRLYGMHGSALRRIRDPRVLVPMLRASGFPFPQTTSLRNEVTEGNWLEKRLPASGGLGVRPFRSDHRPWATEAGRVFYQQRIGGKPCSAVYIAASGAVQLLGATRQLIGPAWGGCMPFQYCGSIGPLVLPEFQFNELVRLGAVVAKLFGAVGIFGIDLIDDGQQLWPIEVNPRYPASTEIIERAREFSAIAVHVSACRDGTLPSGVKPRNDKILGKAILYARRVCQADTAFCELVDQQNEAPGGPWAADVPHPGEYFSIGQPVVTLFTPGDDEPDVEHRLREQLDWFESALAPVVCSAKS